MSIAGGQKFTKPHNMSDIIIHHLKIFYDESDERVIAFIKYLKRESAKEELDGYYREALSNKDGKLYVKDKVGNEFTLICSQGHNCVLKLRGI